MFGQLPRLLAVGGICRVLVGEPTGFLRDTVCVERDENLRRPLTAFYSIRRSSIEGQRVAAMS
jgi:hypothetical protein